VLEISILSSALLIRAIAGGVAGGIPLLSQRVLLVMAFGSAVHGGRQAVCRAAARRTHRRQDPRKSLEELHQHRPDDSRSGRCSATAVAAGATGCGPSSATATTRPWSRHLDDPGPARSRSCATPSTSTAACAGEPEEIALRDRVLQLLALAWIGTVIAAAVVG
jgi:decaprenyl-phosphate phosphoribosyltransferase